MSAVSAERCLPPALARVITSEPKGRTVVIGAGKAAASMAQALEADWQARFAGAPLSGCVVTRYQHGAATRHIEVLEAGHPLPDNNGQLAVDKMLHALSGLGGDDLVVCLLSGGASALLSAPAEGLSATQKRDINQQLLRSGATIHEMNTLRKHLSAIKGGRLAAACQPAQLVTLMISDVPGNDASVIGSGPTVADPSTCADALAVAEKYAIELPPATHARLKNGELETPKPDDAVFACSQAEIIATAQDALNAAADFARAQGITPLILGDLEGEAREVAKVHAGIARQIKHQQQPASPPCLILSGGETSVTARGNGRGGRNTEFLLALGLALDGEADIDALAADTDGIDGMEDNAGAWLAPDSLLRAEKAGLNPAALLADNNAYTFFEALDNLLVTTPTRTNVNDLRAILIR